MDEAPRAASGEPTATDRPAAPTRWLVVLMIAIVGLATWWWSDAGPTVAVEDAAVDSASPQEPVAPVARARVRGRVLVEVPGEPAAAQVVVDGDTAHVDEADTGDAHDTEAEPPPEVATTTPPPASCRIRAWQQGVAVAPAVTCDGDGHYEIELHAGIEGIVAFDLEVPGHLRAVVEAAAPAAGAIGRLPDVALGVGQSVGGTLTDSRGAVLVGLEITARPDPDLGEPEPWRTQSTAEGTFAFDTLPPGPVVLRVTAPGFASTVLEVIAPEADVQLVLDRLYELRGNVVGPPEVLARTRARVEGSGVWPPREVALDAGGFAFPDIPEGVYALVAIAAAVSPGEPEFASIPLEDVAPDGHVTLALVPAHRVPVSVVDADGAPVADARVTLGAAHLGLLQQHGRTGPDGAAALGPVPNGMYVVRADADGFLPAPGVEVAVADAAPAVVVLRMARPGRIRGIVIDQDDRRVAEATIEVRSDTAFSIGEATARRTVFDRAIIAQGSLGVTSGPVPEVPEFIPERVEPGNSVLGDPDGEFVLEGLTPGTYTLRAVHGRFAASDPVEVRVRPGSEIEGVRLRVRRGHPLGGRLLDGNGRPITDGWIELDDGSVYGTDDRGVFDAGLRRGQVVLVARAPAMVPVRRTLEVAGAAVDVELTLVEADAVIRGHVVDDNLRPLDGVQVSMRPDSPLVPTEVTWTDARGEFEFAAVPQGPVSLVFDHAAHAPATIDATAVPRGRERAVEVTLVRGWALVVDVRDADTGVAIPSAKVTVGDRRGVTDRGGTAEFAALGDDALDIEVEAGSYGRATARARRDGDRTTVIVELREGGSVQGVVTDWAGEPVAGADVVIKVGDAVVMEVRTDARGQFDAGGIPEGDVVFEAFPPADREHDLAPVAQAGDVLRGRTTRGIDLRFDRR